MTHCRVRIPLIAALLLGASAFAAEPPNPFTSKADDTDLMTQMTSSCLFARYPDRKPVLLHQAVRPTSTHVRQRQQ
jgi:hypothetical protein